MPRLARGFTLLELMVVVVLIGIILTFVVRSVGDGGRADRIKQEAQRIAALVELVGEEAVLKSTTIGMRFEPEGYRFFRWVAVEGEDGKLSSQWQQVEGDDLLRPRQIDSSMQLKLLVEGFSVSLGEEAKGEEGTASPPQAVFLPGGERTPFEVTLSYQEDGSGYRIEVPPLGLARTQRLEAQF